MNFVFIKFVGNSEMGGAVDMLEGRAAIERHLERLEECANKILMKSSNDNCKVLCLRQTNPLQQYRLGTDCQRASLLKRTWWAVGQI